MSQLAGLLLPLMLLPGAPAPTERKFDAEAAAKAVAPFLDERAVAVVHFDLKRVDVAVQYEQLATLAKLKSGELVEGKKALADNLKKLTDAGARDLFIVFSVGDQAAPFLVMPLEKGGDAEPLLGQKKVFQALAPDLQMAQIGQAVVAGKEPTLDRLKTLKPKAHPEVAQAFAALGDGVAHMVLFADTVVRDEIPKQLPALPQEWGGASIQPLTDGLRWAALKIEVKPKVKIQVILQAKDKDTAKAIQGVISKTSNSLQELPALRDALPESAKLIDALTPQLDGDRFTVSLDEMQIAKHLPPVATLIRNLALLTTSKNNLQQLGLAMYAHRDAIGTLPAVANFDKQNKPLLSWRVHLLPYLEEGELYKQFKLDEPWDSEHNKKLIAKMPKVFANPYHPKLTGDGKTTYLAPVYKDANKITALFTGDKDGMRVVAVTDGMSNTVMLVDVEESAAVTWTKPEDLKLDPKDPHKSLSARHGDCYLFLFGDGTVTTVTKKIDKETLWAIFTANGGEVVNLP